MRPHKTLTALLLCMCLLAPAYAGTSARTAIGNPLVSKSAAPPPTGEGSVSPETVTLGETVTFEAHNLKDQDTITTTTITRVGDNCSVSSNPELVNDNTGCNWTITEPGIKEGPFSGETKEFTAQAWNWSTTEDGDTGATVAVTGLCNFDDGRGDDDNNPDNDDPFHDKTGLLVASPKATLLIPDRIVPDEHPDCFVDYINSVYTHMGSQFRMLVVNTDNTGMLFNGMKIKEEVPLILCSTTTQGLERNIEALKEGASHTWTVSAGFFIDRHTVGSDAMKIFDAGNTSITLIQRYLIVSDGWNTKNPEHAVGREKGSSLSGYHFVIYSKEAPSFYRVTKDGKTCICTPTSFKF